jgi:hypothetical protein
MFPEMVLCVLASGSSARLPVSGPVEELHPAIRKELAKIG